MQCFIIGSLLCLLVYPFWLILIFMLRSVCCGVVTLLHIVVFDYVALLFGFVMIFMRVCVWMSSLRILQSV